MWKFTTEQNFTKLLGRGRVLTIQPAGNCYKLLARRENGTDMRIGLYPSLESAKSAAIDVSGQIEFLNSLLDVEAA